MAIEKRVRIERIAETAMALFEVTARLLLWMF
jgi:hypothetical protein